MENKSLGIFETFGFIAAITGADAALKSAEVNLLGCRQVGSGLVSILLSGDVSSVKVAVDAGCQAAGQVGMVKWQTVIARQGEGLELITGSSGQQPKPPVTTKKRTSNTTAAETISPADLDPQKLASMRVIDLRELARQLPGIALDRRTIRSARKEELLNAIHQLRKHKE